MRRKLKFLLAATSAAIVVFAFLSWTGKEAVDPRVWHLSVRDTAPSMFAGPAQAATNPFMDIPDNHWARDALRQLIVRGIIPKYDGAFRSMLPSSRYEAASMVARALAKLEKSDIDKISEQDIDLLRSLIVEFKDELKAIGVRVDLLDERIATVKEDDIGGWSTSNINVHGYFISTPPQQNTARYGAYSDNPLKQVSRNPFSTFGLDVNTTSYANVRRFLNEAKLPPSDAVRVEELINYFPAAKQDMAPERLEGSPFYVAYETAPSPWNEGKTLLWISLTARGLDYSDAPPANLVFLVDVSGSMEPPERLPLVKSALKMLVGNLRSEDMISLVTYAGATNLTLEATSGGEKAVILSAIDRLGAGGSTAGAAGLRLAYEQARKAFINGGVNRILLCTDGDFNVGVSSQDELRDMVTKERESGVTLSILGFGTDNLNDSMMTEISKVGNGNYCYIDSMSEARKVLDEEMASTLVTVAKDVKAQIEFNPANVIEYRQIGYEKRQLEDADFNDDAIDAGDVGAGRRLTILYELTPAGGKPSVDESRYQSKPVSNDNDGEAAYLKFRWKEPDGDQSSMAGVPILKERTAKSFEDAGAGLRFFAAVAAYGQKLRDNTNLAGAKWSQIESWADAARGDDPYRAEFLQLVKLAGTISGEER
ncbi:MAG: von Willebrand factor type A domain-containing protein [Synergistaceae bacterium]|jgi:Ca-activated chloride channel family protein|nr:von Willebrand factor type A domain-containing protein [Synergistaceae bacterium]